MALQSRAFYKARIQIVRDTVRRFHHLGNRTIAKYILENYGPQFDNDLEKIRSSVRHVVGKNGERNRQRTPDKTLFRDTVSHIPETWRKIRTDYQLAPGLWLVLSDLHVPYHEPAAIEAAVQYGHTEKINGIFFNGDVQDCAAVSYWPTAKRDFPREIELTIDFFDFIHNEFPKAKKVYKPGNHEYRLPRYFQQQAKEIVDTPIVSAMEEVMGYEQRGIEFLDYFQKVMAGKLPIIHGHEIPHLSKMVNAARGLYLKAKTFCACSHCHSRSEHTPKTIHGDLLTCWSFGCLCDLNPDYNPFGNDWNHGFALVNVDADGQFEVVNRRILPHRWKVV